MDGKSYQKTISKAFPASISGQVAELVVLALIGALGVLMHAYLRIPFKLPGHHGVIYMAILLSGKLLSKRSYAASLSSIGAATMLLLPIGFKDAFMPVVYLFPGLIVDLLFYNFKKTQTKVLVLSLICGLAYMSIPVTRIIISKFTGFSYGLLIPEFPYRLLTHFIFGFSGGFIASGTYSMFRKRKK
jgi:hypothetical protein